jgi:polysaccharide export outer membrane protein
MAAKDATTQFQMTNSSGATIEQVHVSGRDQQAQVRVDGIGHLTYEAFRLNQPDRLVLDFSGVVVHMRERSLSSSFYPVRLVRIGQFKANVARVVIEVEEQVPYTIAESSHAVIVVFSPVAVAKPPATAKSGSSAIAAVVPPQPVPSAALHSVEDGQEARSLSESSTQLAMARPSLGVQPATAAAREPQPVQAQTQPATSGPLPQPAEKSPSQPLSIVNSMGQQPTVTAGQMVSGYVLGPDDEIVIRGIETPEISDKPDKPDVPVLIGTNGDITLPLIGRIKAGGLTVEQLETELNRRFKDFIQDPQISVTVTEFRSEPVSVFGAVTKPGVIQLRGGQTLYEVLSLAGGPRENAGSILTVTRPRQNGDIPLPGAKVDPTGQFTTAELNLQEILEGKDPAVNIEVKPNDVISVSEASSNMVYVVGDVQHGGAFTLGGQRSVSVLKALAMAGGLGRTAKPEKARIVRQVAGEPKLREIPLNVKQILSGKSEDIALGPDDVLVIPTSSRKTFTTTYIPAAFTAAVGAAIYHY